MWTSLGVGASFGRLLGQFLEQVVSNYFSVLGHSAGDHGGEKQSSGPGFGHKPTARPGQCGSPRWGPTACPR